MRRFPSYQATLKAANSEQALSFTEVERQHLPTDHTVIGRLMAQNWWLPDTLCDAIRHHHDEGYLSGPDTVPHRASRQLIAVSQLAEHLLQKPLARHTPASGKNWAPPAPTSWTCQRKTCSHCKPKWAPRSNKSSEPGYHTHAGVCGLWTGVQ